MSIEDANGHDAHKPSPVDKLGAAIIISERGNEGATMEGKLTPNAEELNEEVSKDHIDGEDEESRLRALATDVRDQDDLERDVGRQVYQCLLARHVSGD